MVLARNHAVMRSQTVAIRFNWDGTDATVQTFADGNGNGVRNAEIANGVDAPVDLPVRLSALFAGVVIGSRDGSDPIRLGISNLLSFTPLGTATPGSIYVRGDGVHFAIRVFGATGRTRLLRYDPSTTAWVESL